MGGAYHDESNEKSHRKACHDRNPPRVNEKTQPTVAKVASNVRPLMTEKTRLRSLTLLDP